MRTIYIPKILDWCELCQNRSSGLDPTASHVHSDIYSWVQGGTRKCIFPTKTQKGFCTITLLSLYCSKMNTS